MLNKEYTFKVTTKEVYCIIIIEKETIFDLLTMNSKWIKEHTILVTGLGYPSLLARRALFKMWTDLYKCPIFGLFDCDPHGFDIFTSWKMGGVKFC